MNSLIYYKPAIKNFGDHLNERLIQQFDLHRLRHPTLGIGSIVTADFLTKNQLTGKSIFSIGSGCRGKADVPDISFIEGSFVRGPLSAQVFKNEVEFISDGAYLLRQLVEIKTLSESEKKYPASIVPYFRSLPFINWAEFEASTGIHVIDPTLPKGLDYFLQEIAQSERVIAEAMHGAIISDILRIPWVQLDFLASNFESQNVNSFKWKDWQLSINQEHCAKITVGTFHPLIHKTKNFTIKYWYLGLLKSYNRIRFLKALQKKIEDTEFYLSTDDTIKRIESTMSQKLELIRHVEK